VDTNTHVDAISPISTNLSASSQGQSSAQGHFWRRTLVVKITIPISTLGARQDLLEFTSTQKHSFLDLDFFHCNGRKILKFLAFMFELNFSCEI